MNNNYNFYKNEKKLMKKSIRIIDKEKLSDHDREKKINELFHLLVYFDINNINYEEIIPHEPGDFIVTINNKKILFEITYAFGIFNKNIKRTLQNIKQFNYLIDKDIEKLLSNDRVKKDFLKDLASKQSNNNYNLNDYKIDEKVLLIVTIEFNNCPNTGEWFIKFISEEEFKIIHSFDRVSILDYGASGKEVGPVVINDFEEYYKKMRKIYVDY